MTRCAICNQPSAELAAEICAPCWAEWKELEAKLPSIYCPVCLKSDHGPICPELTLTGVW